MDSTVNTREIAFRGPHWDEDQAPVAAGMLAESPLIVGATVLAKNRISVTYDLRQVTFTEIETALQELGFHLDNSVLTRLFRAYYAYCDDTQRANLQVSSQCFGHCARRIFVREYQKHEHGCRDQRPAHWRSYW